MATPPNPFDQFDASAAAANPFDQFDPESTPPTSGTVSYANDVVPQVPTGGFLRNAALGAGQQVDSLLRGGQQLYARATGNKDQLAQLQQQQLLTNKAAQNLDQTWGAKVGNLAETTALTAPLMAIPGAQGVAGGLLAGSALGALQPTTSADDSVLRNTAIGGGAGALGAFGGGLLGDWLGARASQPFLGWGKGSANAAAADSIGARSMAAEDVAEAHRNMASIFQQARSPTVSVPVGDGTANTLEGITSGMNSEAASRFMQNSDVRQLTGYLGETPTAQQLGSMSTRLRQSASQELTSENGNREVGLALQAARRHVDDLVGGSIQDPNLAAAYNGVRSQYRNYENITATPTIYNSAKGEVNMTALANRLQRTDERGYMLGGDQSPLYQAARWGQATGGRAPGAPRFTINNLALPFAGYYARQAIGRPLGGLLSRTPGLASAAPYGAPGAGIFGAQQAQGLLSP